jgi:hypothetical protein
VLTSCSGKVKGLDDQPFVIRLGARRSVDLVHGPECPGFLSPERRQGPYEQSPETCFGNAEA